jgi:hypothetical protein
MYILESVGYWRGCPFNRPRQHMSCMAGNLSHTCSRELTLLNNTQSRFQVPYMQCGCPAPDETVFKKFIRIFQHYTRTPTRLQASLHPDHIPATHPSIHNAVLDPELRGFGAFRKPTHTQRDEMSDLVRLSRPLVVRKKRSKKSNLEPPSRLEGFVSEKMIRQPVNSQSRTTLRQDWDVWGLAPMFGLVCCWTFIYVRILGGALITTLIWTFMRTLILQPCLYLC